MRRLLLALPLLALQCNKDAHERTPYTVVSSPRDWDAHPAIVQIDGATAVYAMSDIHGGYDRMIALLAAQHVIASATAPAWSAGTSVLVVSGDLFDKGPSSLEAVDLLRALEPQAAAAGGRVVFTFGNHEAEFLDDPENDKATKDDGVDLEMNARGLSPLAVANGSDPRGVWLRDRPFGVRIDEWFFSHAGNTKGRTIAILESVLRAAVTAHDYDDPEIVGDDSILESRGWYAASDDTVTTNETALGVRHIVFGHDPDALGPRGEIALSQEGRILRIDCGMSPDVNDSMGRMLRIHHEGSMAIAESLDPDGNATEIWRGPRE